MSIVDDLSNDDIVVYQDAIAAVHLQTARAQAVGGELWDVTAPGAGDTITGPAGAEEPAGEGVTVYAFLVKASDLALALSGGRLEATHWEFRAPLESVAVDEDADGDPDTDGLWEGRTIISQLAETLRFRVGAMDVYPGYVSGTLELL